MPLKYYLTLQYPVTLTCDSEGGYVAKIKDLLTQGETLDETMANIKYAKIPALSFSSVSAIAQLHNASMSR